MYHVFLADDEPYALLALKNLIDWSEYGYVICGEAQDGETAKSRIFRMCPEVVLSDIRMPGMDGLTLLSQLREQGKETEVILVSGYTDFEYARRAISLGCAGYLVKPVEEQELVECLKKLRSRLDVRGGGNAETGNQEKEGYHSEKRIAEEMVRFIQEHYAQGITLRQLAEEFGLSESYTSTMIKKCTHKTFSEHLTETRIRKAQEYLSSTNDTIEEIAARVGYPDYTYFTKVYKKATGITPSAYRRRL